jgi:uncharacterized RDD family membrane protein YckC
MEKDLTINRIIAQILDLFIYYFLSSIPMFVMIIIITIIAITTKAPQGSPFLGLLMAIALLSLPITYVILNSKHLQTQQATLGYRIMKLKLTTTSANKNLYLYRTIAKLILAPFYFVFLLGLIHLLVLITNKGKYDLLDKFSATNCSAVD